MISPLTDASVGSAIELVQVATDADDLRLDGIDAVIAQRAPFDDVLAAERFVERLAREGVPLIHDNDDALHAMDRSHPEFELYEPLRSVVDTLHEAAAACTYSTAALAELYHRDRSDPSFILPNALDPRLWRAFRYPDKRPLPEVPALVYMGTATHDADLELVMPALDRLAVDHEFTLTLIGASRQPPERDWLRVLPVPRDNRVYPRFVRWLRAQGPFSIGIAPLVDNDFNRCKSDIKLLDYAALGVTPVVSSVPAYGDGRRLHSHCASANVDEWVEVLSAAFAELDDAEAAEARRDLRRNAVFDDRPLRHLGAKLVAAVEQCGIESRV